MNANDGARCSAVCPGRVSAGHTVSLGTAMTTSRRKNKMDKQFRWGLVATTSALALMLSAAPTAWHSTAALAASATAQSDSHSTAGGGVTDSSSHSSVGGDAGASASADGAAGGHSVDADGNTADSSATTPRRD
jgi:hypothetical protein